MDDLDQKMLEMKRGGAFEEDGGAKQGRRMARMEYETPEYWQKKLGIHTPMTREEGLEKFRQWRESKRTCERCKEREQSLKQYCLLRLVCEEADKEEQNEDRGIDLGKESGSGHGGLKTKPVRTSPTRATLDKHSGKSLLLRAGLYELDFGKKKKSHRPESNDIETARELSERPPQTTPHTGIFELNQLPCPGCEADKTNGIFCHLILQKVSYCHRWEEAGIPNR